MKNAARLITLCSLLLGSAAHAQWPAAAGGLEVDTIVDMEIGASGSVYVLGRFDGTMTVGETVLDSEGLGDVYLIKYSPGGSLLWAVSGGSPGDEEILELVLDASGNAYVAGNTSSNLRFGNIVVSGQGGRDGFVVKASPGGEWEWVRKIDSAGEETVAALALVAESRAGTFPEPGFLVVGGTFECELDFRRAPNPQHTLTATNHAGVDCLAGNREQYLAKLGLDGEWVWADMPYADNRQKETARLTASNDGSAYVVGRVLPSPDDVATLLRLEFNADGTLTTAAEAAFDCVDLNPNDPIGNCGTVPEAANSNPKTAKFFPSVFLSEGQYSFVSQPIDLTGRIRPALAVIIRMGEEVGDTTITESPENRQDLFLEYTNALGQWQTLEVFEASKLSAGQRVLRTYVDSLPVTDDLKIRFKIPWDAGDNRSFWHIEAIELQATLEGVTAGSNHMYTVGNLRSDVVAELQYDDAFTAIPEGLRIDRMVASERNGRLLMSGQATGVSNFCGALNGSTANYVLSAQLGDLTFDPALGCWLREINRGAELLNTVADIGPAPYVANQSSGVLADQVLVTGRFTGTFSHDGRSISAVPGGSDCGSGSDVYLLALDAAGTSRWLTGGASYDPTDGVPGQAGGLGCDSGRAVAAGADGNIALGMDFQTELVIADGQRVVANGDLTDVVVSTLSSEGLWSQDGNWVVGVPLPTPANAETRDLGLRPDIIVNGRVVPAIEVYAGETPMFHWIRHTATTDGQLVPVRELQGVTVAWHIAGEDPASTRRIDMVGGARYPEQPCGNGALTGCYQVHIQGTPVELNTGAGYSLVRMISMAGGVGSLDLDGNLFTTSGAGFTPFVYALGDSTDETIYPTFVHLVRTLPYTQIPRLVTGVPARIGEPVTDAFHNEPGRTGYVINELAFYDGVGASAAYNRAGRTGQIIPVNRHRTTRIEDLGKSLIVAWYHRSGLGVYWPEKAVAYEPTWPVSPDLIVIASQQGTDYGGQEPLDPAIYNGATIYQQNDPLLPGYNPNDEHAMFAPSNIGSPHPTVFALRSDFGASLPGDEDAPSDPYVLIKYRDLDAQLWRFRVYQVVATNAEFRKFSFAGFAGTLVTPPYPLNLLPGCPETSIVGQAADDPQPPPPFYMDYKNSVWGISAGQGAVRYWYPLQAGFLMESANTGLPLPATTCVPLLARLPEAQGGTVSRTEPIDVAYELDWPPEVPTLTPGETLLKPRNGLPEIFNQAAVTVAYDAIRDEGTSASPTAAAAKLIDPLNPRSIPLAALPPGLATQVEVTTGRRVILGSSDGTKKLPETLRRRLRYDPLSQRLMFSGIFDETTTVGDPILLLNIMSERERDILIDAYTGNADNDGWQDAVEALFMVTRNPNGIGEYCPQPAVFLGQTVCSVPLVTPDGTQVLAGVQDADGDGVLEPFEAGGGVKPALTAGLSDGNGYMTLVFNDDPALTPLPVSVEIIRVGCQQFPSGIDAAGTYKGQIHLFAPDDAFDEQIVLRHSGDFAGDPDGLEFEWYYQPAFDSNPPAALPRPESGQLNGWIRFGAPAFGANEITVEGANVITLSDNWFLVRYRGLDQCASDSKFTLYAGQPDEDPTVQRAQLAEGWVKRVVKRLNVFDARVADFASSATNNYVSMLRQLGERYEGPIALSNDPANLNELGLIEAYTTVMNRAMDLSVDAVPPVDFGPANDQILLIASRLVDFYTLLGNEAYADAQDPTVGIQTDTSFASLAPTIFPFQNQLDSLLEEELTLLRGRDTSNGGVGARPVYNRLLWNFTTGDGEVAYALSYDISDANDDGFLNETDARIQFPQGHGDAWGHYLTATDVYYDLLRHPFFTWQPKAEAITVAGTTISVDFEDERQFAATAAAKARAGAEIVDLTYRQEYVADPQGQYQGYKDRDPDRAWGVIEWGRRAGQAALFDWVTANAVLPAEAPEERRGIQHVDRATVTELREILAELLEIQTQVDEADQGLNPLGLAQGVVPFDIDPFALSPNQFNAGRSHFEQVYDRAITALQNATRVWDYANSLDKMLRRNQDTVVDIDIAARQTELSFRNQLIDIFGTPYPDDMGPGGTFPADYNGHDRFNYQLIDSNILEGTPFDTDSCVTFPDDPDEGCRQEPVAPAELTRFSAFYQPSANGVNYFNLSSRPDPNCFVAFLDEGCELGDPQDNQILEVKHELKFSELTGTTFEKPSNWTAPRRVVGRLQEINSKRVEARVALARALRQYENLRRDITDQIDTIEAYANVSQEQLGVARDVRAGLQAITLFVEGMNATARVARWAGDLIDESTSEAAKCLPLSINADGGDTTSAFRCSIAMSGTSAKSITDAGALVLEAAASRAAASKEDLQAAASLETQLLGDALNIFNLKGDADKMLRKEPILRAELYQKAQALLDLDSQYRNALAEGQRIEEKLIAFRRRGAAQITEYRYEDMAFRIFRNDALQKYRGAFEQAARMVYLAATAYDYETNLIGSDGQAGENFLTDIVRERSIGQLLDGQPLPGSRGLADPLARMGANFDVLKGQMGFNNPQFETNRFSLRRELYGVRGSSEEDDAEWRTLLLTGDGGRVTEELGVTEAGLIDDLNAFPIFRRYARPFAPDNAGPQPAIVLRFPTAVRFGKNFFEQPLLPGDSSYDASNFATKVRSVGVWFDGYDELPLAATPRVYLFPIGADVLRVANANDFSLRDWTVIDQRIPVPFALGAQDLEDPDWIPTDNLLGSPTELRRFSRFRAYPFSETLNTSQVSLDSRLVGRSVWNREWVLIIPGESLLFDPQEGLETFIYGAPRPGETPDTEGRYTPDQRDGNGVRDIFLYFQTYAYSGN